MEMELTQDNAPIEKRQGFPLYIPSAVTSFALDSGAASGAAGASARIKIDLANRPFILFGIRVVNVWSGPDAPTAEQVQQMRWMKEALDDEQTISITLSQQNPVTNRVHQRALCGSQTVWHPFPTPFPMAGANMAEVEVRRLLSYPNVGETVILPSVQVVFHGVQLVNNQQSEAPARWTPQR